MGRQGDYFSPCRLSFSDQAKGKKGRRRSGGGGGVEKREREKGRERLSPLQLFLVSSRNAPLSTLTQLLGRL